ncbi:MAG TPA: BTAD domain-containing putative transcriptional regulator [Thermoleophilaceae bacterium]|nr:BTAD domain-containing putative transcriptional regulator [Thermoleophilaceae bacterium]
MGAPSVDPGLTIRLFGSIAVEHAGRRLGPRDFGGTRPKQVLEILLAARGRPVPTERLAELLWNEELPEHFAGSLQTFVSVLRRHLSASRARAREIVVTEREAYRFAVDQATIDLDRFDELLEQAGRAPTEAARRVLADALSLARGDVLEDEPYADWAEPLRGTYRGRVLGANLEAAEAALACCDYRAGLSHAQAATTIDRFSERAHRTGMLALYAMGRTHEALEGYRRLHTLLDGELGLEPGAETRALETAILRQDDVARLLPRPAGEIQLRSLGRPWLLFLGRRAELAALERVARSATEGLFRIGLVEADAGLGKSRLLDEFASALTGVRVGRASCSALERHLPYVPLAAALRDALSDIDLARVELPALRGILPELGVGLPPAELPEIDALEAIVEVISRYAPLILIIDDLHLADASTIAALGYVQRRCARVPAAVIGALRGEEAPPDHPLRRLEAVETVALEPLAADELAPLGIPEAHARTGGHPEFVAALIADGRRPDLRRSLREMLVARCRAEGAEAYRILVTAATLPQPFEPELLAALLDADPMELTELLERLCDRRILRIDGLRFSYRYAIFRDVLAANVSPARQRLLQIRADAARENSILAQAGGHDIPIGVAGRAAGVAG